MATRGPDPNVTDRELITAVNRAHDAVRGPVVSTAEIATYVDMSGTRIRERVDRIDAIKTKKIGGGPQVYWLDD